MGLFDGIKGGHEANKRALEEADALIKRAREAGEETSAAAAPPLAELEAERAAMIERVTGEAPPTGPAGTTPLGEGPIDVKLDGDAYRPGDTVTGVICVTEALKAKEVRADLCLVEVSQSYVESLVLASSGPLPGNKKLAVGDELPFSLTIPGDAPPDWGNPSGLFTKPMLDEMGGDHDVFSPAHRLFPGVVGVVEAGRRNSAKVIAELPLDRSSSWPGPAAATGPGETKSVGRRFGAELAPDRWSVRRGEEVTIEITNERPEAGQPLEAGLICMITRDELYTSGDADGSGHSSKRETMTHDAILLLKPLDSSLGTQTIAIRVPENAPFTYPHRGKGASLGFEWKAVVREPRKMRRDPRREIGIQVLP